MGRKPTSLFAESCCTDEDGEFIASHVWVYAETNGYYITVETDPYEGSAMMSLPAARKVHAALGRAIEFAEQRRSIRPPSGSSPSPESTTTEPPESP